MINPCDPKCERRSATCHCTCKEYIAFQKENEENNRKRRLETESRILSRDHEMKYRKNLKNRGKRK